MKYKIKIRSRHGSHDVLRKHLPRLPIKSVVRLGSTTTLEDVASNGGKRIEINTIESIKNSANKLLMKQCFQKAGVKTANWQTLTDFIKDPKLIYPVVVKNIFGSRGRGNTLIKEADNLPAFSNLGNYIVEEFKNYNREYRLHVTKDGCFYTCRKMLKQDTPDNKKWFRNDSNSVWILEENEQFEKPVNWNNVIEECVKALISVGLDVGAMDLRIQSSKDNKDRVRENPEFIILECNSAPSLGKITAEKYLEMLPKLILSKSKI